MSPLSPTSTTARPRWSIVCCSSPALSAKTRRSPSAPWTPTTWSASAASRSWPRPPRCSGKTPASTSWTRRATPISAARSSASSTWWTARWCWWTRPKALKVGLKPIVVINKVDRPDARPTEVINEVFDLFAALDASEEQLDFPILYGSAKQGWMAESPDGPKDKGMQPLFDLIERHVAPPIVEEGPFRMIGTILEANPYLGRIITGRISSGTIKPNQAVKVLGGDGKLIETGRITKIIAFRGIERTPLDEAEAGDIVAIAGLTKGTVADTFCDPSVDTPLKAQPIDPPTVSMSFIVNNSPLAGTKGDKVTSRMIRARLLA